MATANSISKESIEQPVVTYPILTLRAQLRAAASMLMEMDCYGERSDTGSTLCDLGFMLMDADGRLGEIYAIADKLESQAWRIQNAPEVSQAALA